MVKVVNASKTRCADLPIATDQECAERRKLLIMHGVVTPAGKNSVIFRKNSSPVVSTVESSKVMRKNLIDSGIIDTKLCHVESRKYYDVSSDQGEYRPKPITSDEEYERHKQMYFRMMQEILHSRKDLKLILGPKNNNDPDWYF